MSTAVAERISATSRPNKPYEYINGPDYPFFEAGTYSGFQPILMFLGGNDRRWLVCEAARDWREAIKSRDTGRVVEVRYGHHNFQKRRAWFFRKYSRALRRFKRICAARRKQWAEVVRRVAQRLPYGCVKVDRLEESELFSDIS